LEDIRDGDEGNIEYRIKNIHRKVSCGEQRMTSNEEEEEEGVIGVLF
jgi:hypothetical protein